MSEASQKTEVGTWGATLGLVKKKVKEAKEKLAGIEQEYKRKKMVKEKELQDALSPLEKKLAGLNSEYEKRRQEGEAKLQWVLAKRERENKLRTEKVDAELRAKDALVPEAAKRGLTLEQYLKIVKRIPDLDAGISQREKISGQWDKAIFVKQKQSDKIDRQNEENERQWGELTTKLKFAKQLLQRNHVEDWQQREKIRVLTHTAEEIAAEGQRKKSVLRDEIASLERERDRKQEEIKSMTELLNTSQGKIDRIERLHTQFESLKKVEVERIVEGVRKGLLERVDPILSRLDGAEQTLAHLNEEAEVQRVSVMALSVQIGEKSAELSNIDRKCGTEMTRPKKQPIWTRQPIYDAKKKLIGHAVPA